MQQVFKFQISPWSWLKKFV